MNLRSSFWIRDGNYTVRSRVANQTLTVPNLGNIKYNTVAPLTFVPVADSNSCWTDSNSCSKFLVQFNVFLNSRLISTAACCSGSGSISEYNWGTIPNSNNIFVGYLNNRAKFKTMYWHLYGVYYTNITIWDPEAPSPGRPLGLQVASDGTQSLAYVDADSENKYFELVPGPVI